MNSLPGDVLAFRRKFGQPVGTTPAVPDEAAVTLCCKLIDEEYRELLEAIGQGDLPQIAKEAGDLKYVVEGMLVAFGIDSRPVDAAIHKSNMSKDGSPRGDGKITKGEGYVPPDIAGILDKQGPIDPAAPLTDGERAALEELEHRLAQTVRADIIGTCLREIRDRELYRGTHEFFGDYCRHKWQYSRHIADLFIACADPDSRYAKMANKIKKNSISPAPSNRFPAPDDATAYLTACLSDRYLKVCPDAALARRAGVSESFVADLRESLAPAGVEVAS